MVEPRLPRQHLAWQMFRYSLAVINQTAERYSIEVGIEPHDQVTTKADGLLRLVELVPSPWIGINFDTGNSYLAGSDPIKDLQQVAEKVLHVHAKDIAFEQASRERGQVTGTPAVQVVAPNAPCVPCAGWSGWAGESLTERTGGQARVFPVGRRGRRGPSRTGRGAAPGRG